MINQICKKEKIDYVVMGNKQKHGISDVYLGRQTVDVVLNANCPVLAVPENAVYKTIERVTFATDYHEIKEQKILEPIIDITKNYEAELTIINVEKDGDLIDPEKMAEGVHLNQTLETIPHQFYHTKDSDIAHGIDQFVHEYNVDLLGAISRKHNFFGSIFHESVTKNLSLMSSVPLLILHEWD